jgi:hypothetical protein
MAWKDSLWLKSDLVDDFEKYLCKKYNMTKEDFERMGKEDFELFLSLARK